MQTIWSNAYRLSQIVKYTGLALALLTSACSKNAADTLNGLLNNYDFAGIDTIIADPDGNYLFTWTAPATGASYILSRIELQNSAAAFTRGITAAPNLPPEEMPTTKGTAIKQLTTTTFLMPGTDLKDDKAYAFQITAMIDGKAIAGEAVFVIVNSQQPTLKLVSGNGQTLDTGGVVSAGLKVQLVKSAVGVADTSIEFTMSSTGGSTLKKASILTDKDGNAENFITTGSDESLTVTAKYAEQTVQFTIQVGEGATSGSRLLIVSGNNQSSPANVPFANALSVQAMRGSSPVANASISFLITSATGGTISSTTAITNAVGLASITVVPGATAGAMTISALWADQTVARANFTLAVIQDQLTIVSGNGQIGDPAVNFSTALTVLATSSGSSATGQVITFRALNGGVPVTLSALNATTDGSGAASITVQAGAVNGTATIQAAWNGLTQDFTLTISSNNGLTIVGGNSQTSAPAVAFASPIEVRATKNGQVISGAAINFTLISGASATFSSSTVTTNASGLAQTTVTPASGTAGSMVVRAVYGSASVDFNLSVIDQSDAVIAKLSGDNQTAAYNTVVTNPLVVEVRKGSNSALQSGITVRFAIATGNGTLNSSANTVDVQTNTSGQASVTFRTGTLKNNTVNAYILNNPTQTVTFNESVTIDTSTPVSLSMTAVQLTPATLQADGASTTIAKVTLKDQYGNTVPATDRTIVFSSGAGSWSGGTVNNGDGSYQRTLVAPVSVGSGSTSISATHNGSALTSSAATLAFASGAFSATTSTITVAAASIAADGNATTLVTVTLRDVLGNQLSSGGRSVVLTASGGTWVSAIVDNSNGTYTRTLKSSTLAQTVTISATVDAVSLSNTATLNFTPGAVDPTKCLTSVSPSSILPNGIATTTVTATLRDTYSNPLTSGGATVAISSTAGSFSGAVSDLGNGTYRRTLVAAAAPATATVSATVGGVAFGATAKVYMTSTGAGPSTARSTISLSASNTQAADGTTTITAIVTLKDSSDIALTSGGSNVTVATTSGTLVGSVVDNGNGTYSQLIRAPASSAIATVSAAVDGNQITNTTNINWYGPFSLSTSTVSSTPSAIDADGTSQVLLSIQAKDSNSINIPVGGVTGLALSSTAGTLQGSLADNNNGTYSQNLRAPSSASTVNATVSATRSGTPLSSTAAVQFYPSTNLSGVTIDCANIGTYANGPILVDGGTLTMNTYGNAAGSPCPNSFVFSNVIVRNGGRITHSATTATVEYGIEFTAANVTIDGTSFIDVNNRGYFAVTANRFRVKGNVDALLQNSTTPSNGHGASYGGEGYGGSGFTSHTYGNLYVPFDLGAAGNCSAVTSAGNTIATGGGRVKITLQTNGVLTLNGQIRANAAGGQWNGNYYGAGAGGSIQLNVSSLVGSGSITANGGGGSSGNFFAGGGGRVAIYYNSLGGNFVTSTMHSNVQACGGSGGSTTWNGAPGTVYAKQTAQTYGDLLIANCGMVALNANTTIRSPAALIPQNLNSTTVTSTGSFGDAYGTSSPFVGYWLDPNTTQNASGFFTHSIFKISAATANNVTIASGDLTTIATNYTVQNSQIIFPFDRIETRDQSRIITSAPLISFAGDLTSGSATALNFRGIMPANLEIPNATTVSYDASSYSGSTFAITQRLHSGVNLTLKGSNFTSASTFTGGSLTLDAATFVPTALKSATALVLSGNLTLLNNAGLYQAFTTTTTEYALNINAGGLNVGTGSVIGAKGRGFPTHGSLCYWYNLTIPANTNYCGGHGGVGGNTNNILSSFGNPIIPNESGGSDLGGPGGGIIRIDIGAGVAIVDGSIDASGARMVGGSSQSAGGTVYLNVGSISGAGTLMANGGEENGLNGRSGGGGRIALYYQNTSGGFAYPGSILGRLQVNPGASNGGYAKGGGGTIYLKGSTQTYGDLIVDANANTGSGWTYINMPLNRASQTLTATTLTDAGQFAENGLNTMHLVGSYLNPNINQNSTPTMTDDTMCKITAQTTDTLTVTGCNMTTLAASGDTYRVVMILDKLSVNNSGYFLPNNNVLVMSGDVTSGNNDALMSTSSVIRHNGRVEFANVRNLRMYGQAGVASAAGYINASGTVTLNTGNWTINDDMIAGGLISFVNTNVSFAVGKGITSTGNGLTLDGSTLTIGKLRGSRTIDLAGPLTLLNSATITQHATTLAAEYSLEIAANGLSVGSGSTISANGRGYVPQATVNNLTTSFGNVATTELSGTASSTYGGGSHGGRGGGWNACNSVSVETYGSIHNPYESGSSGKYTNSAGVSPGGGIIRISLGSGNAVVNGLIDVSASSTTGNNNMGAGGSVYLSASDISGAGTLRANGGSTNNQGGGGGGGRIAVYYTTLSGSFSYPANALARLQAYGGTNSGATCSYGAAGTIYLKSAAQTYGDLIVANNNIGTGMVTSINTPANATSTTLTSTTLTKNNAFRDAGVSGTNSLVNFMLNPNTAQNGTVTLNDDTMYTITAQDDHSLTTAGPMTATGSSGSTYQVVLVLDNLEIKDGAILLTPGRILVRNGDVSSSDNTTANISGPIHTSTTAVEWANLSNMIANPGSNAVFYLPNLAIGGDLTVQSGTVRIPTMTVGGNVNITGGTLEAGNASFTPNIAVTGNVNLTNATSIRPIGFNGTDNRLYITAANMDVCATCSVNATGRGYYQSTGSRSRCYNNQDWIARNGTEGNFAGAHGGQGAGNSNTGGDTWGSFTQPTGLGCSGSDGGWGTTPGGGAIRIGVSGTLTNNGSIVANGDDRGSGYAGSGGSIYIETNTLAGATGTIKARGGNVSTQKAGGGGRIAIYYQTATGAFSYPTNMITNITAEGGNGNSNSATDTGAAGTIYLKNTASQTYGDLLINNLNLNTNTNAVTMINAPTLTTSTSVAAQLLSRTSAFTSNLYLFTSWFGFYVNPNTAQNGTGRISDDSLFFVTSNTANALTTSTGDMTTVATGGNTYRMALVLDNFEVRNMARFNFTNGQIRVMSGDISSNDTTTFTLDGVLNAHTLDLGTGVTYVGTGNASKTVTYECRSGSCP